jgi:hypothetical protein
MNKQQMIEQIRQRNQSASNEFLLDFDEQALEQYLQRLTSVVGQRGKDSVWVRTGDAPAVVSRRHTGAARR